MHLRWGRRGRKWIGREDRRVVDWRIVKWCSGRALQSRCWKGIVMTIITRNTIWIWRKISRCSSAKITKRSKAKPVKKTRLLTFWKTLRNIASCLRIYTRNNTTLKKKFHSKIINNTKLLRNHHSKLIETVLLIKIHNFTTNKKWLQISRMEITIAIACSWLPILRQ